MRDLTEIELSILNSLYFTESFENIAAEVGGDVNIVADGLKFLIDAKMVAPMSKDEESGDFVRSYVYDADHLADFHYVATKDGLLRHNER